MYVTVKFAWIVLTIIVGLLAWVTWKYPRTAVPAGIAVAATAALAMLLHI
jgi:hypothetical protein